MAGIMPLTQYTWSNESVFELIEMVRERPILWDQSLEEHRDRVKKHAAWREIAEHFGLEKSVVEKKMRMMIGQYRREISRIAGGDSSKWFAFQKLSFLSGMQELSGGAMPPVATVHVGPSGLNAQSNELVEERNSMPLYDEEEYSEDSMSCQKTLTFTAPVEPPAKRPKLGVKRPMETSTDAIVKMLYDEKSSRDEFVVYGEYIANKLRHIQSSVARNTAQFHINNILYKAETGQFDEPAGGAPSGGRGAGAAGRPAGPEPAHGARWDNESVTSLPESTHSLEDTRVEIVRIKMEN